MTECASLAAAPALLYGMAYASPRNWLSSFTCLPSVRERLQDASTVETSCGTAYYRRSGIGKSDQLLVLLAGIGHDPSYWPAILRSLSETSELIALDLFGRGGTDAGYGPYDADSYANFVHEVLEKLGVANRPLVMIGFSFGGAVAAHMAATCSNVIGALLVVPAGVAVSASFGSGIRLLRRTPRVLADVLGVVASWGGLLCFGHTGHTEATTEDGYANEARRVWHYSIQDFCFNPAFCRVYMHIVRDFPLGSLGAGGALHDSFKRLKRLGPNLQIVVASSDSIIPAEEVKSFASASLPDARVLELPGGHDVQWDRPSETVKLITRFIDSLPASALSRAMGS
eukprot:TRINITY_DN56946_c0_g1_i1.p1 TRINITY_DN56946_c0_g1~~TRINITY_DN56946_c0_g1_i1.p1  ORF type:complete len:342 (-),score=40.86 TRINITY_DN56946_c0_g1_i1:25-1050(-)